MGVHNGITTGKVDDAALMLLSKMAVPETLRLSLNIVFYWDMTSFNFQLSFYHLLLAIPADPQHMKTDHGTCMLVERCPCLRLSSCQ